MAECRSPQVVRFGMDSGMQIKTAAEGFRARVQPPAAVSPATGFTAAVFVFFWEIEQS